MSPALTHNHHNATEQPDGTLGVCLLILLAVLAIWWRVGDTGGMQGNSDQNLELLDAGCLVGHLVAEGSMYAFLAQHRRRFR